MWDGHKFDVSDDDACFPVPTPVLYAGVFCFSHASGAVLFCFVLFQFHGGCDMVLLQNPDFNNGQGLYIHIRTKIVRW